MTHRQLLSYAEVWALRVLSSPSHVQLASSFLMSKMLRSRFWEFLNLLGSTCVFHGIYSVFVLSDPLWFGSFFPVEFATPVAVAVLGLEPLQLHRP